MGAAFFTQKRLLFSMPMSRKERPAMTNPKEKTREELQAEIEDGKKKIRQFENREKMLRQKLSKEERRTRSHRLIVRGAVFESIVPEAKNMTDEEAAHHNAVFVGRDEDGVPRYAHQRGTSKSVTIKGYLGILARNTAINEKKKCIPDYQINDEVIADISDDFNQVELRLLLANALRKLNKDEQLILVLFYFQNEKIADISRITGIPASTVKSKLKRCKEKMKKFLEEGGNQYENFV